MASQLYSGRGSSNSLALALSATHLFF